MAIPSNVVWWYVFGDAARERARSDSGLGGYMHGFGWRAPLLDCDIEGACKLRLSCHRPWNASRHYRRRNINEWLWALQHRSIQPTHGTAARRPAASPACCPFDRWSATRATLHNPLLPKARRQRGECSRRRSTLLPPPHLRSPHLFHNNSAMMTTMMMTMKVPPQPLSSEAHAPGSWRLDGPGGSRIARQRSRARRRSGLPRARLRHARCAADVPSALLGVPASTTDGEVHTRGCGRCCARSCIRLTEPLHAFCCITFKISEGRRHAPGCDSAIHMSLVGRRRSSTPTSQAPPPPGDDGGILIDGGDDDDEPPTTPPPHVSLPPPDYA